jgi:hypothetical protein
MSDHEAREAYEAAIAEMPATPGRTDRPTVRASAAQRRRMTAPGSRWRVFLFVRI